MSSATAASAAPATPAAAATPAATGQPAERLPTTRVTVLTGKRMTDLALPAAAPMESFVDDTVGALAELLEDTPADVLAGFDFAAQGVWAFARPGFPPMRADQSLDDAGVVDGSLLTLVSVSRTERYRPLVEDVIDAIAVLDESPVFNRAALNRFVYLALPVMVVIVVAVAAVTWWHTGRDVWWPAAIGVVGLIALAGSVLAVKPYTNANLAESLLAVAFPSIAVAVGLSVPLPRGVDTLGPPQLAAATGTVFILALVTRGGPRKRIELATFTVVVTIALTAVAVAYGYDQQRWVPAGAILFGLFIVTSAAKLTVAVARIALPPIPVPGETIEHEELLDAVAGREDDEKETRTWQAIIASVPTSAKRLTDRSNLAKKLLVGFVWAGALVFAAGTVALLVQGHFFVHTLVVAALVTVVCGFRARLYADPWCAWALLVATAAVPLGVMIRLSWWYPQFAWLYLGGYLATAVVVLALITVMAGVRRVSPVSKRLLELLDGVAVAAIIPMLLWICGIYDMVRNITF